MPLELLGESKLPCAPPVETLIRVVSPVVRLRRNRSIQILVSPGTRLFAKLLKRTRLPSKVVSIARFPCFDRGLSQLRRFGSDFEELDGNYVEFQNNRLSDIRRNNLPQLVHAFLYI